jgi:hypothetical protein
MKPSYLLITLSLFLCYNTGNLLAQTDCDNTSTGNIPITEIGPGLFMGYQGGLYPGGSNTMPSAHALAGKSIGNSIKPLNEAGEVDFETGKLVFVSFGASTAGNTFNTFKSTVNSTPDLYNPCLKFVNLCMGGKGLESMIPPQNKFYWSYLSDSLMIDADITAEQVQIGWIKTASKDDSIPEFPLQADSLYAKFIPSIQRIKEYFPNIKILYISSHAYGGYAGEFSDNADLAGEPAAYYGGFAVKWVVEDQIEGSPELVYSGPDANSPWLSWGPYFWADGLTPRVADGLTWECTDYETDGGGFHLSEDGKMKESDMLIDFLYNNSSSKKWFRNGPKWTSCIPAERLADGSEIYHSNTDQYFDDALSVYPSPNNGNFYIGWHQVVTEKTTVTISNSQGQQVYFQHTETNPGDVSVHIQLTDLPAGIYFIQVNANTMQLTKKIIVN